MSGPISSLNVVDTEIYLPVQSSVVYNVVANLYSSVQGIVNNTVRAKVFGGVVDSDSTNDVSTDSDIATPIHDISITKDDGITNVASGTYVTYTIKVANLGPSDARVVTVTDSFASVLTDIYWNCTASTGAICDVAYGSGQSLAVYPWLTVGSNVTYTITALLFSSAQGNLVNNASVISDPTDTQNINDYSVDTDTISPLADLVVSKTDGQTTAVAGTNITYTIDVNNLGPSDAFLGSVTVDDTFPVVLTNIQFVFFSPLLFLYSFVHSKKQKQS